LREVAVTPLPNTIRQVFLQHQAVLVVADLELAEVTHNMGDLTDWARKAGNLRLHFYRQLVEHIMEMMAHPQVGIGIPEAAVVQALPQPNQALLAMVESALKTIF
jgi:hypothetical protein